jgi:hypothetical protein
MIIGQTLPTLNTFDVFDGWTMKPRGEGLWADAIGE